MAKGRRFSRFLLLLVVLAIAFLLFELNRFFPGTWPGGGGDAGLARRDAAGRPDPERVRSPDTPAPPPEPRSPTVRVRVTTADGGPVEGATLAPPGGGEPRALGPQAPALAEEALRSGFEVEVTGVGRVAHAGPPKAVAGDWEVRLPRAPLPPAGPATNPSVRVRSGTADGKPVAGARISATLPDGTERSLETGADGDATLPDVPGTFRVCAEAEGHGEACVYATVRRPDPTTIVLPVLRDVETAFRAEDGTPLRAAVLRLVDADGTVRALPPRDGGHESFKTRAPALQVDAESLEIEVEGRPPVRVPLARLGATTTVPRGRTVRVRALDEAGVAVRNARVEATFAADAALEGAGGVPLRVEATTGEDGEAALVLPDDRSVDALVESGDLAPGSVRVDPGAAGPVEARLARGVRVPVRVLGPDGAPLADARVSLLAHAGARRDGTTDAQGRVDLAPVAAGSAEVYAHRRGSAWTSVRVEAAPSMAPVEVRLSPGASLRLVVEDPWGVPVEGVRVRSTARPGGAEGRAEAVGPDDRPWRTDDHGMLVVEDLPDRELDLYLTKSGYVDEVLARVRPGTTTVFTTLVPSR